MIEWWEGFSSEWVWTDPQDVLLLVAAVFTALIPAGLWWLGSRQTKRDSVLNVKQAEAISRQEKIFRRQRRDSLLESVPQLSDSLHLGLLWDEVHEYEGKERELLLAAFRSNVALALPGTSDGVELFDDLNDAATANYVHGLERRYSERIRGVHPYPGLIDFVAAAANSGANVEASRIVSLVTGPTSELQRPGHAFYRELVNAFPASAAGLLRAVENIDYRSSGGLRLNVITGTLLAIKDVEIGRFEQSSVLRADAISELRGSVPTALAFLLHRNNLRSFERWSLEGSTEPVSATVAWLIRAVGWLADTDNHLAMRMVQNLADAIESIPAAERGWGIDDRDVRQGFEWIKQKQPTLWETYGEGLESAATSIGPWKAGDHDNV